MERTTDGDAPQQERTGTVVVVTIEPRKPVMVKECGITAELIRARDGTARVKLERPWLPIETAPQRINVLIYVPDAHDDINSGQVVARCVSDYWCSPGIAGWQPTHWQPLPEPPNLTRQS